MALHELWPCLKYICEVPKTIESVLLDIFAFKRVIFVLIILGEAAKVDYYLTVYLNLNHQSVDNVSWWHLGRGSAFTSALTFHSTSNFCLTVLTRDGNHMISGSRLKNTSEIQAWNMIVEMHKK